jgi:hypothetical protein
VKITAILAPVREKQTWKELASTKLTMRNLSMSKSKFSSIALATTAALIFSTAPLMTAQADDAKVKCEGANACKGMSACSTADSACKGKNACKGKGFTMASKAECDAAKAKKSS